MGLRKTRRYFSSRLYGLSEGAEQAILAAILTFAILFDLRLALDEANYLDENHRKLAIPAGYVECGGKEEGRHDGDPPCMTH
jgi:hypothetical protein